MMPFSRLIAFALLASCAATLPRAGALAEPLDRAECKSLEAERRSLWNKDIQAALERGPDWVKDHLHSAEQIEKVREYLLLEEKTKFRCRTDGVVVPKPKPVPLPDRKPEPPQQVAEEEPEKVLADAASTSLLPLRKPSLSALSGPETAEAEIPGEPEEGDAGDPEEAASATDTGQSEPGPSQAVADSDKTAPPENKATQ
jgi:hypothetical protein